ncbi:MAG: Replicase polyprotein 1ab [Micromonosporaceae bacterium]
MDPNDLDREVRAELRPLSKSVADAVASRLVVAAQLLDEAPEEALAHALAARRGASRIGVVREAVGLAAYRAGDWRLAISELRAHQRITGRQTHLAVIADCERGLGRPERAIDIYRGLDPKQVNQEELVELLIVAAGARRDLGQLEAATAMLQRPARRADASRPWGARLCYAYADLLLAKGDEEAAKDWFRRAVDADVEGQLDAAERLLELEGVRLEELEPEPDEDPEPAEESELTLDGAGKSAAEAGGDEPARSTGGGADADQRSEESTQ